MKTRAFSLAFVFLAVGVAGAAEVVTVRPLRVTESRAAQTSADPKRPAGTSTLSVLLELKSKNMSHASQYGEIRVTSAKHDKDGTLKLLPRMGLIDLSKEFAPIEDRHGEDITRPDAILVELRLEAPPRAATVLTALEGSIKLLSGTSQEVSLTGVVGKLGSLSDKTLEAAGLTLSVVKATKEQSANPAAALVMEVTGDMNKLVDLYLLNAKGDEIEITMSSEIADDAKKTTFILEADKPLPKDAKLMLEVIPKLERIDVPFKLANIKLP